MKRSTLIAIGVLSILVVMYWRNMKKDKKANQKQAIDDLANQTVEANKEVNSYDKDKNYQNTGVHVFDINWGKKKFTFLSIMDDEAVQGKFVWDGSGRNRNGHFEAGNGWRCRYRNTVNRKGNAIAIVEIINSTKGYRERKTINFTTEEIGR